MGSAHDRCADKDAPIVKSGSTGDPSPLALIAKTIAVAMLVGLCCWISIRFTREPGGTSTLWIASGILTGIVVTSARRYWLGYVIAAFAANVIVRIAMGDAWHAAVGLGFASILDTIPVLAALAYLVGDATDLARINRSARVALGSTLAASAVSALVAAWVLALKGAMSFGFAYATWFTSHTLGMVIFGTLTVVMRSQGWRLVGRVGRRVEMALVLTLLGAVCLGVFTQSRYPLLFLVYPPLLLSAFRHRLAGVVIGTTIVTAIAIAATLAGNGPFDAIPNGTPSERILLLQVFIATTCLVAFPVATALAERRLLARNLRQNQRRLRAITDNLPAFVSHVDLTGHCTFANAYMGRMLGVDPDALLGRSMREVAGDGYEEIRPHMEAALRGELQTHDLERDFNGQRFHLQSTYIPDVDPDGQVIGYYLLSFDISRLKRAERELSQLARKDSLTDLPNRRHFDEEFATTVARQRRSKRPIALLYLDIDRFKEINDSHGHAVGDDVLREFAQRLKGSLRATDFVARLGGDEFAVLLEEVDTPEIAQLVASKLIVGMRRDITAEGHALHVTTSIGIAFCQRISCNQDELIRIADGALYQAKAAGRNTWRIVMAEDTASP
jgi:diguanylate cyclase (GGDEF)-like protein/PAS domain S-box-containing protein